MLVSALLKVYKSTDRIKWWERAIPSSSTRRKTSFTDVSYFDDQQHLRVDLTDAAAFTVAFSKHRCCALKDQPCMYGIKEFDSMAIQAYLNQSCCTLQPQVPGSSFAFTLELADELNQTVSNSQ